MKETNKGVFFTMANQFSISAHLIDTIRTEKRGEAAASLREELAYAAVAASTASCYKSSLKTLDEWLDGRELTDRTLAEYVLRRHEQGAAPLSVKQYVQAAAFRARTLRQENPVGDLTRNALRIVKKQGAGRGNGQAPAILEADVERIVSACDRTPSMWGIRDSAILSVAFDGLLRVSECAALTLEDIEFRDDHGLVRIRRGKTDQSGQGQVRYIRPHVAQRVRRWITVAGITEGPLFRPVVNGSVRDRFMGTGAFQKLLKKRVRDAGMDPSKVTFHGLRRGCATQLARDGAPLQLVAKAGGWRSPAMVLLYTEDDEASKGAVATFLSRPRSLKSA